MNDYPPVLNLSLTATGIAVARILARRGVKVYGTDTNVFSIGRFSKYVRKPDFGYKTDINSDLLEKLARFSKKFNLKPVLIVSSDDFIEYVSENYNVLKEFYSIQESLSPEISKNFLNKKDFYKLCEKHKVSYPKTLTLTGEESLEEITENLRFPMIVKPNLIHKWKKYLKGNKVLLINNKKELKGVLKKEKNLLIDSLLQEVIPGPDENIFIFKVYFGKDGELKASYTARKIRQYPPYFGSFSLVETIENKEVKKLSIDFLKKIRFKGLCGTEFKYDPRDNDYKIIEINIRPQLWEGAMKVSNAEIVWYAYCDLTGLNTPKDILQKNQVKFSYLLRDVYSAYLMIRDGNLTVGDWFKSYKNLKGDALIDFREWKLMLWLPVYVASELYQYKIKPIFMKSKI